MHYEKKWLYYHWNCRYIWLSTHYVKQTLTFHHFDSICKKNSFTNAFLYMFIFIVIWCEFWCAESMKGEVFKSSIFLCYSNYPGEILDWLKIFLCRFDKEINLSFSSNSKDWSTDRDYGFTALIFPKNLLEKIEHRDKVSC